MEKPDNSNVRSIKTQHEWRHVVSGKSRIFFVQENFNNLDKNIYIRQL